MSNAPSKPVSFSRLKVGYISNRPRMGKYEKRFMFMAPCIADIY